MWMHNTLLLLTQTISISNVFNNTNWIVSSTATTIALLFALLSIILSFIHISKHLYHYTMPQVQIYVIRILLTCPMYAVTSSLALTMGNYGLYAEVVRDVYEAFVIYSFLNLILEYSGGETDCVHAMENEAPLRMPFPLCCMKPKPRDTRLMRFCSQGVLQFIIAKPAVATVDLVLLAINQFYNSIWQLLVAIIYNISYIWALYCLYVFYLATKNTIKKFRPVAKFATVKSIIFATYYQSLFLQLTVKDPEHAYKWNDFLLCIEMVFFACALMVAFPVKDFEGGMPNRRVLDNIKDVMTVRDIYQDVYHNFNHRYQDYALQRSESEAPATSELHSYFSNNLDTVALEMTERYRGRSRRLAFNALLRGSQPIRAKLRSSRFLDDSDDEEKGNDRNEEPAHITVYATNSSEIVGTRSITIDSIASPSSPAGHTINNDVTSTLIANNSASFDQIKPSTLRSITQSSIVRRLGKPQQPEQDNEPGSSNPIHEDSSSHNENEAIDRNIINRETSSNIGRLSLNIKSKSVAVTKVSDSNKSNSKLTTTRSSTALSSINKIGSTSGIDISCDNEPNSSLDSSPNSDIVKHHDLINNSNNNQTLKQLEQCSDSDVTNEWGDFV